MSCGGTKDESVRFHITCRHVCMYRIAATAVVPHQAEHREIATQTRESYNVAFPATRDSETLDGARFIERSAITIQQM